MSKLYDPWTQITEQDRDFVQRYLSLDQTDMKTDSAPIDKDWLLLDGNIAQYMLYYHPRNFWEWEPFNDLFFEFLENETKGMIWAPGGHGKTTGLKCYFGYLMNRAPSIAIGYTEKNLPIAEKRGLALLQELSTNKRLIDHFGAYKPTVGYLPWSASAFTIRQRPEAGDTPTFMVFGAGGASLLGIRFNALFNDDPVTDENSTSEVERAKLLRWFNKASKSCRGYAPPENPKYTWRHYLVGTVFAMNDLYHSVEQGGEFPKLWLKAVINEQTGETLSRRFAYEDEEQLKELAKVDPKKAAILEEINGNQRMNLYTFKYGTDGGRVAYYQRYQNIAIDEEAQEFKDIYFIGGEDPEGGYFRGCFDDNLDFGMAYQPNWVYMLGLDPYSGSQTSSAKRMGMAVIGAPFGEWKGDVNYQPGDWYLVDVQYGRYQQQDADVNRVTQLSLLVELCTKYHCTGVIEANACQRGLQGSARTEAKLRNAHITVVPHYTEGQKLYPEIGIPGLLPRIQCGALRIPHSGASRARAEEFRDEFTFYPSHNYSDVLMAYWFAAHNFTKKMKSLAQRKKPNDDEVAVYRNRLHSYTRPRSWSNEQWENFLLDNDMKEAS